MIRDRVRGIAVAALWVTACSNGLDEGVKVTEDRGPTLEDMQRRAGGPVKLELGDNGLMRVLAATPQHPVPAMRTTDAATAAAEFLAEYHNVFDLGADEATAFEIARVDIDGKRDLQHVTLQRTYEGIPVFQGAISVHMNARNDVFHVLGDQAYQIERPINRRVLKPADAALAAGKALGLGNLILREVSTEG